MSGPRPSTAAANRNPWTRVKSSRTTPCGRPVKRQVAFTSNNNGTLELRVAEAGSGTSRAVFAPGIGMCTNLKWSPDGKEIAFRYGTPTRPADLWVANVEDGSARQLTDACAEGSPAEKLIEPEKIAYQSTDGLTIHAYLYSPTDRSKKYPGLIYIHGGPTLQFFDDLQANVQYLVQRGYVVLLPNVRGSTGYGKAFEEANDKDWGRGDLEDAIAGTEYMKGLSYVDPGAMGISGRSYGGILSMYAITYTRPRPSKPRRPCRGMATGLPCAGRWNSGTRRCRPTSSVPLRRMKNSG